MRMYTESMQRKMSVVFFGVICVLVLVVIGEFYFLDRLAAHKVSTKRPPELKSPTPDTSKANPFIGRFSNDALKALDTLTGSAGFKFIDHYGTNSAQELKVELKQEGIISALKIEDSTVSIDILDKDNKKIAALMIPENTDKIQIYSGRDASKKISAKELKIDQKVDVLWKTLISNGNKLETMDIVIK